MIPFTEQLRYEYPLTPDSVIIDVGGYEGNWSRLMVEKYGCKAHIFEPVDAFYKGIIARLANHPQRDRMTVHHFGVGENTRDEVFRIKGDMTGILADGPEETVKLIGIVDLLQNSLFAGKQIGVLKLNCEGMEYEILSALLDHGLDTRFDHIQVQFHNHVPHAEERRDFLKNRMLMNHRITWDEPWVWTGFQLK